MGLTVKDLSSDQLSAYNAILGWSRDANRQPVLSLGGYAGSGKSLLVSLVAEQVDLPAFCAYTGKATSVLRRKLKAAGTETVGTQPKTERGLQSTDSRPFCGTIHSLIYRPCSCLTPETVEIQKPCPEKDCVGELIWAEGTAGCLAGHRHAMTGKAFSALKPQKRFVRVKRDENGKCTLCHGKEWLRREALDRRYGLIIVDEASMVDDMMLRDLREYNVPILAVGDHGQLPPVGGSGSLMKSPHLRLEKIHRQAEGNPIIALSKYIRENGCFPDSISENDHVKFERLRFVDRLIEERYADASAKRLLEMGLVCYTNRRRVGLNVAVRRERGLARGGQELPRAGEHVVCLRNMKGEQGRPPVANGMRGVLMTDANPKLIRDPHGELKDASGNPARASETQLTGSIGFPEDDISAYEYTLLHRQFNREKTFSEPEDLARETGFHSFSAAGSLFDFGYAMTCHKMQGSSVEDLVVLAERPGPVGADDWARWCYTAATRAASKLTVLR